MANAEDLRDEDEDEESIEARARAMGWVPEEEWDEERAAKTGRKKPQSWLSAEDYIRKTEERAPAMRGTIRRLTDDNATIKEQNTALQKQNTAAMEKLDDLTKLTQNLLRTSKAIGQREYDRGMADAKAARKVAIEAGDEAQVDAADAVMRDLEKVKPELEPEPKKKTAADDEPKDRDPVVAAWVKENPWFQGDAVLNAVMTAEYDRLTRAHPGMSQQDRLDKAKTETRTRYPEKFGPDEEDEDLDEDIDPPPARNERRRAPAPVGSSSRAGQRRGNQRTFGNLSEALKGDYKRHRDYMKENGNIEYTTDEFVAGLPDDAWSNR